MFLKNKSLSAIVSNQDFINYVIIKTLTCSIFMHFNNFYKFFFFTNKKFLKIHQVYIIKIIKKNYKKARERY